MQYQWRRPWKYDSNECNKYSDSPVAADEIFNR